ncbi:leucine-rich repeat-containing protein 14B [Spea bombifrons]|uniref:leucine-rich repeat-containing protein 14B n=1 Tax=Spea bombifrons TaxID=233779 RepID=UPI00234BE3B1|nr:leucine-rich repeat-containing protein 14B [Spea bombifrons]
MKTLKFIGAEAFIFNEEYAKKNMKTVAHNLYPLLLKACYLNEKVEVIHTLVENWPHEDFILGKILGKTIDCPEDLTHWSCRLSLVACLRGLKNYVLNSSSLYSKKLKSVDITGIKDIECQPCKCKKTLGRWARTELLSQTCFDLLIEMANGELSASISNLDIDVLCNLFVTERNYEVVVQALLMRHHCPLKIRCVDFRADSLSSQRLFYILKLAEPDSLHKLEIVHNVRLDLYDLKVLLNNINFPKLFSLTFPARTFNVPRYTTEDDIVLSSIGEKLSNMTQLTELSLSFSTLTGKIRKLLSVMNTPLKTLEVANCSLNNIDMAYLANSLHADHLEVLDLSGHNVTSQFPSMFYKLLSKASQTLKMLVLEECDIGDMHVDLLALGLSHCCRLQEFKFLGNPMTSLALMHLFNIFVDLPMLKYIEFPVPKDCYPYDVLYPLDEETLTKFDHQKYNSIKESLLLILTQANREDILAVTPLFGTYDPAIQETSNELGAHLLTSFKEALDNITISLQKLK